MKEETKDHWTDSYLNDDGFSYNIPSYKINRLIEIEKENEKLKKKLNEFGKSSSDLKSEFMGEFYIGYEELTEDGEYTREKMIDWTTTKEIFKRMCEYVKNRKDEDYRP